MRVDRVSRHSPSPLVVRRPPSFRSAAHTAVRQGPEGLRDPGGGLDDHALPRRVPDGARDGEGDPARHDGGRADRVRHVREVRSQDARDLGVGCVLARVASRAPRCVLFQRVFWVRRGASRAAQRRRLARREESAVRFHAPRAAPARGATSRETEKPTTTRLTDLAWRWWWRAVVVVSLSGEWEPDSEDVLLQAFRVFDPEGNGYIEVRGAAAQGGRGARGARRPHTAPRKEERDRKAERDDVRSERCGASSRRARRAARAPRGARRPRARVSAAARHVACVCACEAKGGGGRRVARARRRSHDEPARRPSPFERRARGGGRGWSCVTPRHGTRALASNRGASVAPPRAGAGRRRALWSGRGGSRLALAPAVDRGGGRSGWRPVPCRRSRLRQLYRGADAPPPLVRGRASAPRSRLPR